MKVKKRKKGILGYVLALVFFLAAAGLYFAWNLSGEPSETVVSGPEFVPTGVRLEYDYGLRPDVHYFGGGFFFSTKDGIKGYDLLGEPKWDIPLSLTKPKMIGEGGCAIVCENKGKTLWVFSDKGLLYDLTFEDEVLGASINDKGASAVIIKNTGGYSINAYNTAGKLSFHTIIEEEGIYPLSADISGDGRVLAVAALNTNGLTISSHISFYYINPDETQNFADGLFGASPTYEGQVIAKVSFSGNNKLIFISDSQIGCLETGTQNYLKTLWQTDIGNEITDAAFLGDRLVAVAMGKKLMNKEGLPEGELVFYNIITGESGFSHSLNEPVTALRGGESALVALSGPLSRTFTAFDQRGSIIWEFNAASDNSRIEILDKSNKIAYITPISLEIMEKGKVTASLWNRRNHDL